MEIFNNYIDLYERLVTPFMKEHPTWIRLDGATTGGNLKIFGNFRYKGKIWKIHSDSHLKKLSNVYLEFMNDNDPLVESLTKKNNLLTLSLKNNKGYKHLYIYEVIH